MEVAKYESQRSFQMFFLCSIIEMGALKGQQSEFLPVCWEPYISDLFQFDQSRMISRTLSCGCRCMAASLYWQFLLKHILLPSCICRDGVSG